MIPERSENEVRTQPQVFISYARKDVDQVAQIARLLEREEVSVWRDSDRILGGQYYGEQIVHAIAHSRVVMLMCSPEAFESDNVHREMLLTWEDSPHRKYIPVWLTPDTTIPPRFRYNLVGCQWIDAYSQPPKQWLPQLLKALKALGVETKHRAGQAGKPTPKPAERTSEVERRALRFQPGDRPIKGADWELELLLGKGGFGEVWKAHNPELPSQPRVALKFCLALDARSRNLLRNEAEMVLRVQQQIRSEGIVPLLHAYLKNDPPCLEFPYIEGGTLVRLLDECRQSAGSFTPVQVQQIILRIAQIIGPAHRATPKLIHRDLKPSNILAQRHADGKTTLWVTDFGIGAVAALPVLDRSRLTSSVEGNLLSVLTGAYSPLYASPQQMQRDKPDPRDDVYALGVIWYQLLKGNLAIGAPSGQKWIEKLRGSGMSDPAIDLLSSCFEYDPADRPADAGMLAEQLQTLPPSNSKKTAAPTVELPAISEKEYLFWIVIDFGTTNSTVTVARRYRGVDQPGLADEQNEALRRKLAEWFDQPVSEALPAGNRFESEWRQFTREVAGLLGSYSPGSARISEYLADKHPARLYEVITQVEITVRGKPEPFRRAVYARLHEFYHTALRIPSLKSRSLYPVTLDKTLKKKMIDSFMEILKVDLLDDGTKSVEVLMGHKARENFLRAIAAAPPDADLDAIASRFHPSPKRDFGTDETLMSVHLADGTVHRITVDDLMKAGWKHLLRLTEDARNLLHEFEGEGKFGKVVVTYPAAAPPAVRQKIEELLADLDVHDVRTDYNEAVAATIFYLMREHSGVSELGLESFKIRAREVNAGEWVQNILVFDMGGGTTDVALIELKLVEPLAFSAKQDRGAGGRYYRFLPKLLTSTGHTQLGGELMTLRLFHFLKAVLADRLLTAVQEKKVKCGLIEAMLGTSKVGESFRTSDKYLSGSLVKPFQTETWDISTPEVVEARALAEEVMPTCWRASGETNRSNRLQAFHTLWNMAEEAKTTLGDRRRQKGGDPWKPVADASSSEPAYRFPDKAVKQLIELCRPEIGALPADLLRLELSAEQFESVIRKVVDDAVAIAMGTLDRLPDNQRTEDRKVDWLILSGQSCNLELVERTIREQLEKSNRFVWHPERVAFDHDYAKLATSIGACYAEEYRRRNISPETYLPMLRRGEFVLDYDINNLFTNLPCSLYLALADGAKGPMLFPSGTELTEIDPPSGIDDRRARARTDWLPSAIAMTVMRSDFKEDRQNMRRWSIAWGNFDMGKILSSIGISDDEWRDRVRVKFEVDHRLDLVVYACRLDGDKLSPHYVISGTEPSVKFKGRTEAPAAAVPSPMPGPSGPWDDQKRLRFDIAVRLPNTESMTMLFKQGTTPNTTFHYLDPKPDTRPGIISEGWVEQLPTDGPNAEPYQVFVRPPKEPAWIFMGAFRRPASRPVFKRRCRFTLDADGFLRIHEGEPRYFLSDDPGVLKSDPGVVFRKELAPGVRNQDRHRDPFDGTH